MQERLFGGDIAITGKNSGSRLEWRERVENRYTSPRVLILDSDDKFPVVRYYDTRWYGLPGGKVKFADSPLGANLMGEGAFPTLARETMEELGIDITEALVPGRIVCLGLM
jgi:8-oxo-dGTP pyrophosphatase MutT (NUDIX family)